MREVSEIFFVCHTRMTTREDFTLQIHQGGVERRSTVAMLATLDTIYNPAFISNTARRVGCAWAQDSANHALKLTTPFPVQGEQRHRIPVLG